MPFKSYHRGRAFRKNFKKRPVQSVYQIATSAVRGVAYLKGLVNSELKSQTSAEVNQAVPATGGMYLINQIAQGDGVSSRDGNVIRIKSFEIRATLSIHDNAVLTFMRVIILINKQQQADTTPAVLSVISEAKVTAVYNHVDRSRFRILLDRTFAINADHKNSTMHKYLTLNIAQKYNGTTSADMEKNGIYMLLIANEASNFPAFRYVTKITYRDN